MKSAPLYLLLSTIALTGCRQAMTVNLPADFHGGVLISCGSGTEGDQTVTVDEKGLGEAVGCAQNPPRIRILRDGVEVRTLTTEPPMWNRTETGVMAGVSFAVP